MTAPVSGGESTTILKTRGPNMAKTWRADGTIGDYDNAKNFTVEQAPVSNIKELHDLLQRLLSDPRKCLIRGTPVQLIEPGQIVERNLDTFADAPSRLFVLDVDSFQPLFDTVANNPAGAVAEFTDTLPACFRDASYVWALSGSCGHPTKQGGLRAHLYFVLGEALTCGQAEAWAKKYTPGADSTVHRVVQANYTSTPVLEAGQVDPLAGRRIGFMQGLRDLLVLPADMPVPAAGETRGVKRKERATAMIDPRDKPGLIGALCRAFEPAQIVELFPDHFEAGVRDPTRITWLHGGGAKEGLKVTDNGTHIFNSHSTAPVTGAVNLFDFLRAHVFGRLDADAAQGVSMRNTPSFIAMKNWIGAEHPEVLADVQHADADFAGVDDGEVIDFAEAERLGLSTESAVRVNRLPAVAGAATTTTARAARQGSRQQGTAGTVAALGALLRQPQASSYRFGFDHFTNRLMIGTDASQSTGWREVTDSDYTAITERLQLQHGYGHVAREVLRDVVKMVGEENAFDSAQQWVRGLVWDGIQRVDQALVRYFGAAPSAYHTAVARYIFTALVGRIVEPGCKADMVPIACGAEGLRKSSAIAALAPREDFFLELDIGRADDDTARRLQGRMVCELAELRGLTKRGSAYLKAATTTTRDTWVEKYCTHPQTRPRRCIFFGSSNSSAILGEETGMRRWLPFEAGQCDPAALAHDRDQLWAEALALHQQHGIVFREAEDLARLEHENFADVDIRAGDVADWLERGDALDALDERPLQEVTTSQVLTRLGVDVSRWDKRQEHRAAGIMRGLGWVQVRVGRAKLRVWRRPT